MKVSIISNFLALLFIIVSILSCQDPSPNDKDFETADSLTHHVEETYPDTLAQNLLVATLIDSNWVFVELKGILIVALEEKLNNEFSIEKLYISPSAHYEGFSDTITYYLEGRSKGVVSSAVVAIELMIEDSVNLVVNPKGQLHSCLPPDSGLCIFTTQVGKIIGCDCIHKDTSRVCDYITSKDVLLSI